MTAARRLVFAIGPLAIAAMCIFPPWVTAPESHPSATTSAGYRFVWDPPSLGPAGQVVWSSKRQRFERDGKEYVPRDQTSMVLDRAYGFYPRDPEVSTRFARIDYARLAVQWVVVAALVGVAMVVPWPRRRLPKPVNVGQPSGLPLDSIPHDAPPPPENAKDEVGRLIQRPRP